MAVKKKTPAFSERGSYGDPPKRIDNTNFYGFQMDEDQLNYVNAIWNPDKKVILCDAVAGSGKTSAAIGAACMLYHYGLYDGCYYIRTSHYDKLGFLPGSAADKERPMMLPLYSTLIKLGENPYVAVNEGTLGWEGGKSDAFWTAFSDAYVLGTDWENKVVVMDECQCMTTDALRSIITRCHDDCKVIIIGSTLQIQGIRKEESGFKHAIDHFSKKDWAQVCKLTKNYRGEVSAWADRL